jgi:hypothetical protein
MVEDLEKSAYQSLQLPLAQHENISVGKTAKNDP